MSRDARITVIQGDCVDVLRGLDEASIDAIVTDPPYGLEFMGKDWDTFKQGRAAQYSAGGEIDAEKIARQRGKGGAGPSYVKRPAKRCAKCGKQAWSGSPCRCEAPEWIMDHSPLRAFQDWSEAWAREALRVLKPGGHMLAFGGTRTYHRMACAIEDAGFEIRDCLQWLYGSGFPKSLDVSKAIDKAAGAEREAEHWQGWGTALKPANEPIVMARKPLSGRTVARNVLEYGTGAINIDGCRIGTEERINASAGNVGGGNAYRMSVAGMPRAEPRAATGRWPANVILSHSLFCTDEACVPECPVALLDAQSGYLAGGSHPRVRNTSGYGGGLQQGATGADGRRVAGGGASRFFYAAKASKRERRTSNHPTVKPVAIMRYLIRLVTPPGGTILDPFAGSGTTGEAAILEGVDAILIEREAEYVADIRARIDSVAETVGVGIACDRAESPVRGDWSGIDGGRECED